jgi:hypothetical protein
VVSSLLAIVFCTASILLVLGHFLQYGLPPCTGDSWYDTTQIVRVAALFSSGVMIACSSVRQKPALLLLGVMIGGFGWAINMQGEYQNRNVVKNCAAWTASQAMKKCGAKQGEYHLDTVTDYDGRKRQSLTLVAPGTTDKAYNCLEQWSMYGDIYGFKIDESVYLQARLKSD